jgi:hypothetical protein
MALKPTYEHLYIKKFFRGFYPGPPSKGMGWEGRKRAEGVEKAGRAEDGRGIEGKGREWKRRRGEEKGRGRNGRPWGRAPQIFGLEPPPLLSKHFLGSILGKRWSQSKRTLQNQFPVRKYFNLCLSVSVLFDDVLREVIAFNSQGILHGVSRTLFRITA